MAELLQGYAVKWEDVCDPLKGRDDPAFPLLFTESYARGAFAGWLAFTSECHAQINHRPSPRAGSLSEGTLRLREDDTGLRVELEVPAPGIANYDKRLARLALEGPVMGWSIAVQVAEGDAVWGVRDGLNHRRILRAGLAEVSVITSGTPALHTTIERKSIPDHVAALRRDIAIAQLRGDTSWEVTKKRLALLLAER